MKAFSISGMTEEQIADNAKLLVEEIKKEVAEKEEILSITFSGNSALSHLGILAMVRDVADFSKCPYIKKELDKEIKEITQSLRETNREED